MPGPATPSSSETDRSPALGLITWDDDSPTGGNVYNASLVTALRASGVAAELIRVGRSWPDGSAADRARLSAALRACPIAVVDGIVAGNAPEEVAAAVTAGADVSVLVHLPLAEEAGISSDRATTYRESERRALRGARTVICPSRFTAALLADRYGRPDAVVAPPGVIRGVVAAGSRPPQLLCLGALTPTKNQLGFLAALASVADLPWRAAVVGSVTTDPVYAGEVRAVAAALGERVLITGVRTGAALDGLWTATDLLVCTSRIETYGLVVTEALARGIPAVVPAGTGAVEALGVVDGHPPGSAVDPPELGTLLRGWLTDGALRADWRRLALRRRDTLPTWDDTARIVRRTLVDR